VRLDLAAAKGVSQTYDYVIVGSGAAGATAARVLTETGRSVLVLEEGPALEPKAFGEKVYPAFKSMFREMGGQVARGKAFIPVLQGRCLGGTTVINSAIVWRVPDDVFDQWDALGLADALPRRELHKRWDRIERELRVTKTPEPVWGRFNGLMDRASRKLGVSAHAIRRYADESCRGSARCLTGCPHGAKQSMLVSYLPLAESRGAAIATGAEVKRVLWDGSRAAGVEGVAGGVPFKAHARRAVLLCASAIQTPQLLQASGADGVHLGRHFQGHPGCALIGLFDEEVGMWHGATQGFDADEHRRVGRFKIETISLQPEVLFARVPGAGAAWKRAMAEYRHMAIWAVQMRAWAEGSVRRRFFGTDIQFSLEDRDMVNMRRGLRFTAELFFAAGAKAVMPGVYGLPERIFPGQEWMLERGPSDPKSYTMILSHMFGTARMSLRACDGVVRPDFGVHGTRGLYVLDSSVFPTNTGVNPQHLIMGSAWLAAERLSEVRN
jgi:choline dehydrogenase-like flavoprotein